MLRTVMLVCFNCQVDTAQNHLGRVLMENYSDWVVLCSCQWAIALTINAGRCSPLWVALFPNQGVLDSIKGENMLKGSCESGSMCLFCLLLTMGVTL